MSPVAALAGRWRVVVLIVGLLVPSRLLAQRGAAVDSGTVVRMALATDTVRGRLLAPIRPDARLILYCRYPGAPCHMSPAGADSADAARVLHLDVASGSHWQRGALIGGGIGALIGGFGIAFAYGMCETASCRSGVVPAAMGVTAVGAALGAAFGGTSLRWEGVW